MMTTIIKCDRCGATEDDDAAHATLELANRYGDIDRFDICEACHRDISALLLPVPRPAPVTAQARSKKKGGKSP